jgi:hypothetical protein
VTTADKYRRRAQACLIAASSASTEEGRAGLVDLAKTWLRLAQEQEHESANINSPPPSAVDDRPVAQQQQQVQPMAGAGPIDPNAPYKLYDGDERIGHAPKRGEHNKN